MFFLARKNLLQERTRFAISVGGVAFSVLLMILLQGLNVGISNVIGQFFSEIPADLWVAHASTGNVMDTSIVPLSLERRLRAINGVASVKPFGMQSLTTTTNSKSIDVYLIAYDPASNVGRPPEVSQGKPVPGKGEVIVDHIVARSDDIKLGDSLQFAGRKLKVVGFSEGTFMLSSSFAFVDKQDADVYGIPGTTNYYLIQMRPGASTRQVQAAINRLPGVYAHTKAHFVQINNDVVKSIVQPIFRALVVLGALIGATVIGLTIFTSTIEKAKEYGILKAIGLKNRQLYIIVVQQALIAAIIGYALGVALAYAVNPLITDAVPQFVTELRLFDISWIFAVTIGMAVVSSYIPIRRLSKIDPAEVFRA